MLRSALRYPLAGDRADEALVGGWILYLLAGIVPLVPLVPVLGYFVRVLAASARGASDPPGVRDLRRLAVESASGTVVLVAYLVVPVALLFVTAGGLVSAPTPTGLASTLLVLGGGTVTLLVALAFAYLLPVALAAYGVSGSLRKAFDRRALHRAATHGTYFYHFTSGLTVFVVGTAFAAWLWTLHPAARVLAPLPAVYAQFVAVRLWGVGVRASAGGLLEPTATSQATSEPAASESEGTYRSDRHRE